ncbi:PLC-like phosphodiesterase [Pseudohyphozyma bogoriensis]|nr:PLC-like phosphodiesterase [Pseudohyphozyma bogoriensis]
MPHHRWLRKDTDLDAYPHGTGTLQQRRSAGEALGKVEQALEHYLRFESRDRTYYWVSLLAVDPNGAMRGEVTLSIVTRSKLSYNYYRNEAEPTFSAGAWHVSIFQQQFQAPGVAPFGLQIQKTDRSGTPHHWTFHFKVLDEPATYVDEPNGIWSTTTTQGTDEQTVSRGRDASAFLQNFSQAKENGVLTLSPSIDEIDTTRPQSFVRSYTKAS